MAQKKLLRFAQIKSLSNVLEYPTDIAGKWSAHFNNNHPITLELACGRGEYTIGLSALYADKNFIGVDVKGNRMYLGARRASEQSLNNAAFLRTQIEMVEQYFKEGEVDEIWITFPDPQLRTSKAKKRLTHPRFLRLYKKILKPSGIIHLKTDSPQLFNFTKIVIEKYGLTLLKENEDVYTDENIDERLKIKTHYEGLDIAKSNKIFYLSFSIEKELPAIDEELYEYLKETEQNTV